MRHDAAYLRKYWNPEGFLKESFILPFEFRMLIFTPPLDCTILVQDPLRKGGVKLKYGDGRSEAALEAGGLQNPAGSPRPAQF